jgi:hypothetical protein
LVNCMRGCKVIVGPQRSQGQQSNLGAATARLDPPARDELVETEVWKRCAATIETERLST